MSSVPTRFSARLAARNKSTPQASQPQPQPQPQPILIANKKVTPFSVFCWRNNRTRSEVRATRPTTEVGTCGIRLTTMWKDMSESERAEYH